MKDILHADLGGGNLVPLLPSHDRILEAALSSDPKAPKQLAVSFADQTAMSLIDEFKSELEFARRSVEEAHDALIDGRSRRDTEQRFQGMPDECPPEGKRQPFWQKFYNGAKCVIAAVAPLMGGAYLMTAMMDQSFTFAQTPYLALLAAGPVAIASFGMSSWAVLPSDVRKVERRTNTLLVCSSFAFLIWSGLIAMRYGVAPPAPDALSTGFDPTATGSTSLSGVQNWLQINGMPVAALFSHLIAEALLSAGCISSALCSMRKVRRVGYEQTSIDALWEAETRTLRAERQQAEQTQKRVNAKLGQAQALHKNTMETTLQA
ncbi:MAG: hypothetical protein ABJO27_17635, partial [Pseudoruegeria sp.]